MESLQLKESETDFTFFGPVIYKMSRSYFNNLGFQGAVLTEIEKKNTKEDQERKYLYIFFWNIQIVISYRGTFCIVMEEKTYCILNCK